MQLGGVIYNDSADKAARFILNCNQKNSIAFYRMLQGLWWVAAANMQELLKTEPNW